MTGNRTKRAFDAIVGVSGVIVSAPAVVVLVAIATIDTRTWGLFRQTRVGLNGKLFGVVKIRTMRMTAEPQHHVTVEDDPRITRLGTALRRLKLDELPQLWNVARGQMSFVGPRPDVPGYTDVLIGDDRVLLELRPGITGPGSLVFRSEERLLAGATDPKTYNDEVIWPAKVALNVAYAEHATFIDDLRLILLTLRPDVDALVAILSRWDATLVTNTAIADALRSELPVTRMDDDE